MPPMSRLRAQWPSGIPSDLQLEYYRQRASEGGLIFTEATAISTSGRGYKGAPGLYNDEQVTGWKRITDAVHAKGGYIFTQLWHAGRTTHIAVTGAEPVTASVDPAYWANPNYVFVVTPGRLFATVAAPGAEDSGDLWNHRAIPHCRRQREARRLRRRRGHGC